jgi:hypothetical protein
MSKRRGLGIGITKERELNPTTNKQYGFVTRTGWEKTVDTEE